ncbi:MAG: response regulator [Pseudomonadota bacterium]
MRKILIVEDSDMVMKVLRHLVGQYPQYQPVFAASMAQAKLLMAEHSDIFAALVDIHLPDAPNGETVDYVLAKNLPTIVLTGTYDEAHRELLFNKGIVDYVTKEGRFAYNQALGMVQRLEKNQQIKVLVVDDSDVSLKHMCELLRRHLFQVKEAVNGVDAIKVLLENPDIKLLITDYNMPRMDGFELVKNVRYTYDKTNLIMIGVSGESNEALSAKFIKHGANDFLRKPFHPEEFYCRIIHNLEYLELVEKITDTAQRDHLTGLFHRHHFFNVARDICHSAQEKSLPIALVVFSVDNFRQINDQYGYEWGDFAMKHVAKGLNNMLDRFLLCRGDGDEFFVLLSGLDNEKAIEFISRVRQILSTETCTLNGEEQNFCFSAGVTNQMENGIDAQIKKATRLVRLAKESGGNMVLGDEDDEV